MKRKFTQCIVLMALPVFLIMVSGFQKTNETVDEQYNPVEPEMIEDIGEADIIMPPDEMLIEDEAKMTEETEFVEETDTAEESPETIIIDGEVYEKIAE